MWVWKDGRIAPYIYWAVATSHAPATVSAKDSKLPRASNVASGILLAGLGYLGAQALLSGWVTPVCAFSSCLLLFPWMRIPLCRSGLLVPCAIIALGAAAPLYSARYLPHPISFLIAVWMLWTTAMLSWLRLIFLRQQKLKTSQPAPQHPAQHPEDVVRN